MRSLKAAREKLEKLGISAEPLQARRSGEALVALPATGATDLGETVWRGEALARVLQSARASGENTLALFDEYQDHQSQIAATTSEPISLFAAESTPSAQRIAEGREQTQQAWKTLLENVARALHEKRIAVSITGLLDEFYRQSTAGFQALDGFAAFQNGAREQAPKTRKKNAKSKEQAARVPPTYPVHTSQEWLALLHTASDGKYLRHFTSDENRGVLRHQRPDAPFWTETVLSDEEQRASLGIEMLRQAAGELDLDDCFVWLYISDLIAPAAPLQAGNYAGGWVDLDDVARKTLGGYAPNPAEVRRRREKVWHAIRYGARAFVGGQRSVPYFDKSSGKEVETEIYTTPWQIVSRQQPVQATLFPEKEEVIPMGVELVASREWTSLTTSPSTAQFLPMGEMLGAIPPSQPSGAWARALGLAYMHWCRVHLCEALAGKTPPSRRHLLEQFPTKTAPFEQILSSDDPGRALKYWRGAEDYLREIGFIEGEISSAPKSRKGWKEVWLDQSPPWQPGPSLRGLLESLAANRLPAKPRALNRPRRARKSNK